MLFLKLFFSRVEKFSKNSFVLSKQKITLQALRRIDKRTPVRHESEYKVSRPTQTLSALWWKRVFDPNVTILPVFFISHCNT